MTISITKGTFIVQTQSLNAWLTVANFTSDTFKYYYLFLIYNAI